MHRPRCSACAPRSCHPSHAHRNRPPWQPPQPPLHAAPRCRHPWRPLRGPQRLPWQPPPWACGRGLDGAPCAW
ncbi:hypothetical protein DUNSADRAFT_7170 [Dunaliella salina]|uniref:Uncharacterized protein n=1 Tax=Dunaliella salina TaxID=3046 RepID=A0ABQ7FTG9_DUNSA|nr:hypothetical protein DUNSADRAFT_7170 [Dunaliella salina]|eukprot:KAF5825757.1 hypothetical protein DUNSADRAFT_7170 [Dunaliella salina]